MEDQLNRFPTGLNGWENSKILTANSSIMNPKKEMELNYEPRWGRTMRCVYKMGEWFKIDF